MSLIPEKQISKILRGLHNGAIDVNNLPNDLYTATANKLKSGAYEGFGFDLKTAKGKKLLTLLDIRENVYLFSGAKTYTQTREMLGLLKDDTGKVRSFSQYKDAVMPVYDQYNVNWLQSEYITAIGQSQSIEQWDQIIEDKKIFPLLKYSAVIDPHTSDICKPLDAIVRPVDDPFWRRFMPLNHFRCRCVVIQLSAGEERITRKDIVSRLTKVPNEQINPAFAHNPGITNEIFTKQHPYFDVAKGDKALARKNFNLPIPEKD